jgi:hypothetical protein
MSFADDQKRFQNNGFNGDLLAKPGTLVVRFPSWNKGDTLFRPFACPTKFLDEATVAKLKAYNPATLEQPFAPSRVNQFKDEFSDWIKLLPNVVRMAGTERKVTFLSTPLDINTLGLTETPFGRIQRIVKIRAKQDPSWGNYLKGDPKSGAAVPFVDNMVAMQGMVLFHNGEDYRRQPKNWMLVLPRTATQALVELLNSPGVNPSSPKLEEMFAGGDVTHPDRGSFIRLRQAGKVDATTTGINFNQQSGPQYSSGKKDREFQKYEAIFEPSPQVPLDLMLNSFMPWDSVIQYLTCKQQVEELCSAFKPEFIAQIYKDSGVYETYVPQGIRDRYFVSGYVGGYTVPTQAQPQQPQPQTSGFVQAQPQTSGFVQAQPPTAFNPGQQGQPPSAPPQTAAPGMPMPDAAPRPQGDSEYNFGAMTRDTGEQPGQQAYAQPPQGGQPQTPITQNTNNALDRLRSATAVAQSMQQEVGHKP